MHTMDSFAGTAVALRESYAGNLSFVLTGGSFRTNQNNTDACSITSSRSNTLAGLPADSIIKKAYLYWAASNNNFDTQVTLNGTSVNADRTYFEDWDASRRFVNGVADVTNIVRSYRNGTYTVSNLSIDNSFTYCNNQTVLGGWALAVIYESDSEDFRVLNLYEGFQSYQNSTVTLIPDNFKLPANPSGKHAHITWEGDDTLGSDGEYLEFEGVRLSDGPLNPNNNQFNSYSNVQGGFTSYGVDIDEYDISNYLVEGATSVHTVYSAGQDLVLLSAEIVSVSNIPVADLSVSTSNSTGWTQGSNVSKKFTISNSGPNDVPTNSVRFTTTLPNQLDFNGAQGNADWNCSQSGKILSCLYQNKLRSGWSDYLDLNLIVAGGTAGQTINWSVNVDHDTAPYDIFDNHTPNNTYTLNVPVVTTPVVDLSASSKTYSNLSGDSLLAGDTLQYTITIDDASDLTTSGIQLYDDLPANISGFNIIAMPTGAVSNSQSTGGANGTGYLDIQNINLSAGNTAEIVFEVYVNSNAPKGASLQNTASLSYNSDTWIVDTGDITVVEPDLSPSTIVLSDANGGLLKAGDTLDVTITLQEKNDLAINNALVTAHIPAFISSFQFANLPTGSTNNSLMVGGNNGTGYLEISNIDFASTETPTISLSLTIDPATPDGTLLDMSSLLVLGSKNWYITSDTLEVSDGIVPTSGNKQLYLDTSNTMSRLQPSDGTVNIAENGTQSWVLAPALQAELTFDLTDIVVETKLEGNRFNGGGKPQGTTADLVFELRDSDNNLLANRTESVTVRPGRIDSVVTTLLNQTGNNTITLASGKSLVLSIQNTESGNGDRSITLHITDGIDNSLLADGYSAVIINASTVINVDNIAVWSAPYTDTNGDFVDDSGATLITSSQPDTTLSIRANVSDPFGAFDINSANVKIEKSNGTFYDFSGNDNLDMTAIDDPSDDYSTAIKIFESTFTLAESNELLNGWTISVTAKEGVENDVEHTGITGFTVLPFLPNITLTKSIEVINDPINGPLSAGNKPKAIPGAELLYNIHAVNSGRGKSDNNSIVLQDEIPMDSELYIGDLTCLNRGPGNGAGPVCFEDGTGSNQSDLSFDFLGLDSLSDHISFSQDGTDFTYEPKDSGDGYDSTIRYLRISPAGIYKNSDKAGSYTPEFNFSYQVKLK